MRELVRPSISDVGVDGSWTAWALVQHVDDVSLQLRSLSSMRALLSKGEARPTEYAELHDRIRRNQRRLQTYGTAVLDAAFYPIEDEARLERRRRARTIGARAMRSAARVSKLY
ncbi:MAG TPA: hypothetical protein VEK79_12880 [Thermoanaerobaculia bacterium]|nr:hypothetical protein [Thermoanaerobaculia bacterium]